MLWNRCLETREREAERKSKTLPRLSWAVWKINLETQYLWSVPSCHLPFDGRCVGLPGRNPSSISISYAFSEIAVTDYVCCRLWRFHRCEGSRLFVSSVCRTGLSLPALRTCVRACMRLCVCVCVCGSPSHTLGLAGTICHSLETWLMTAAVCHSVCACGSVALCMTVCKYMRICACPSVCVGVYEQSRRPHKQLTEREREREREIIYEGMRERERERER